MNRALASIAAGAATVLVTALIGPDASANPLEEATLTFRTGAEFTRGDFTRGVIDTDLVYLPLAAEVDVGSWLLVAELPILRLTGPANPQTTPNPTVTEATTAGVGDLTLSASYFYLPTSLYLPVLAAGGELKVPTASAPELGTGEVDVSLWIDAQHAIGVFLPFARVGYRFLGNNEFAIQDGFFAGVGGQLALTDQVNAGLQYTWSQSTVDGEPDVQELSPFVSVRLGERIGISPYGIVGLSSSAVIGGAGVSLSVQY